MRTIDNHLITIFTPSPSLPFLTLKNEKNNYS